MTTKEDIKAAQADYFDHYYAMPQRYRHADKTHKFIGEAITGDLTALRAALPPGYEIIMVNQNAVLKHMRKQFAQTEKAGGE